MEMAMAAASTSSAGCDAPDECSVDALVRRHAVDNTVIVTFGNARQRHFTANWVLTLQSVGVSAGILVGMMNMQPSDPLYVPFARALRGRGVGVYTVNSPQVKQAPQGGRWFHVAPLLRTGARLVLSDSDVVWLRDPVPYLRALEAAHPKLDFAVSTDAQGGTDGRRRAGRRGVRRQGGGRGRAGRRGGGAGRGVQRGEVRPSARVGPLLQVGRRTRRREVARVRHLDEHRNHALSGRREGGQPEGDERGDGAPVDRQQPEARGPGADELPLEVRLPRLQVAETTLRREGLERAAALCAAV